MKKLIAVLFVSAIGTMVSYAQSSASTTTESATTIEQVAPVVNAVEAQKTDAKCSTTTKSCCSNNASRSGSVTTSESAASTTDTKAPSCHQVSVSTSAAKPESESGSETPKE